MEYFDKYGSPAPCRVSIVDGKATCSYIPDCARCGGRGGSDAWKHTGWTCYDCGGKGKAPARTMKVYTREKADKLIAARAKSAEKRAAIAVEKAAARAVEIEALKADRLALYGDLIKAGEPFAEKNEFISDIARKALEMDLSEKQVGAWRAAIEREVARVAKAAASIHVGSIGERLKGLRLKIVHVHSFEVEDRFSFGMKTININIMEDAAGNVFIYKGSFLGEKDTEIVLAATVKDHGEREGVKQTILARPKLT